MTYLEELGKELQSEREAARWEQEPAAERVGISRVTLSRYENGRHKPPHEIVMKLRDLYRRFPKGPDGGEARTPRDTSSNDYVSRETTARPGVGEAVIEGFAPTVEVAPRLARNLPLAVREYLLEVRGRFTRANVPEELIDEAMDLLRSPSVFSYFKGGRLAEYNEQDVLDGMRTLVDDVVVPRLKKLGFKVP